MSVHLHPEYTRTGGAGGPKKSAFTTPFFPNLPSLLSTRKRPLQSSPTTPTFPTVEASHGLAAPTEYPVVDGMKGVRKVTARQVAERIKDYARLELNEKAMFPWLHTAAEQVDTPSHSYFGGSTVPSFRGLTVVKAPSSTHFRSSSVASTSSDASSSSAVSHQQRRRYPNSVLVNSFAPSDILAPSTPARFAFEPHGKAISLRGFKGQPAKMASLSDIVVYGDDEHEVWQLVRMIRQAQDTTLADRFGGVQYNVLVCLDSFEAFEAEFPELVAIDSDGNMRNLLNFFEREREEMRVLTQASCIGRGVWLGNSADVPSSSATESRSSISSVSSLENPLSFSVVIEAADCDAVPSANKLESIAAKLRKSDSETINDHGDSVKRIPSEDIVRFEVPNSTCGRSIGETSKIVSFCVRMAEWLHNMGGAFDDPIVPGFRTLLYCSDGYTDTSLLALAYIMFSQRCSLPDAYLFLHENADRSFFVYQQDLEALRMIEHEVESRLRILDIGAAAVSSSMRRVDSGFSEGSRRSSLAGQQMQASNPKSHPWFWSPHFEGSFPSRILPFLFLGNLQHAKNALMLQELGITHVVSVGESALDKPKQPPFSRSLIKTEHESPDNSLWLAAKLGRVSVLDVQGILDDGIDSLEPVLEPAIEFIEKARQDGGKVLIHCRVGVSRSASIVIAYLIKALELDFASAYILTRSRRLNILIQPSLPFAMTLHSLEGSLLKQRDVKREAEANQQPQSRFSTSTNGDASNQVTTVSNRIEDLPLGMAGLRWSNRLDWAYLCQQIARLNERFIA